jgi:hypothetical protein
MAEILERLGISQPLKTARTLSGLIRAFELERLTRPDTDLEELRWRLELFAGALHTDSADAPAVRKRKG